MRYERGTIPLILEGRTRLHCGACGRIYEIPFRSRCEVEGDDDEEDLIDATDDTIDSENRFHRDRACPNCGLPPTRRIGSHRKSWDAVVALMSIGFYFTIAVWLFGPPKGIGLAFATLSLLFGSLAQLVGHLLIARLTITPANEFEIRATEKLLPQILSDELDGLPPRFYWPDRNPAYCILVLASFLAMLPSAYLLWLGDRLNAGHTPALIAPGQRANIQLQARLTALRSVWGGTATAETALPNGQTKVLEARVPPASKPDATTFTTKDREEEFSPTVDIAIPADPALAGRTLMVEIRLTPTVAYLEGGKVGRRAYPEIRETVPVHISSPDEVQTHRSIDEWCSAIVLFASVSAAGWLTVGNIRLARFPNPEVFIHKLPKSSRPLKNFRWKDHRSRVAPDSRTDE